MPEIRDSDNQSLAIEESEGNTPANSPYDHPDIFDIAYPGTAKGDKDYYKRKAKEGDFTYAGIGTGRIFGPMTLENPDVVGIDNSASMIAQLHRRFPHLKEKRVRIIEEDIRTVALPSKSLDGVVAPYSFLTQFPPDEVQLILEHQRDWLRKDGIIHTDLFAASKNPSSDFHRSQKYWREFGDTKVHIDEQHNYQQSGKKEIYPLTEIATCIHEGRKFMVELHLWSYPVNELEKIVNRAGLKFRSVMGDFYGGEQNENSDAVVLEIVKD